MIKALVFAFFVFADGQSMAQRFESVEACEAFARAIAPYVESVDCETVLEPIGIRG